jgi:hypothetical protein
VLGFSNTSATMRSCSAREARGEAFSSLAR